MYDHKYQYIKITYVYEITEFKLGETELIEVSKEEAEIKCLKKFLITDNGYTEVAAKLIETRQEFISDYNEKLETIIITDDCKLMWTVVDGIEYASYEFTKELKCPFCGAEEKCQHYLKKIEYFNGNIQYHYVSIEE